MGHTTWCDEGEGGWLVLVQRRGQWGAWVLARLYITVSFVSKTCHVSPKNLPLFPPLCQAEMFSSSRRVIALNCDFGWTVASMVLGEFHDQGDNVKK
jgi:hypothetical protein